MYDNRTNNNERRYKSEKYDRWNKARNKELTAIFPGESLYGNLTPGIDSSFACTICPFTLSLVSLYTFPPAFSVPVPDAPSLPPDVFSVFPFENRSMSLP